MKILQIVILFLFLLAAAGCKGDEPEATPFIIEDPDTNSDPVESPTDPPAPPTDAPPPTETPAPPTDTATPTATATPTGTAVMMETPSAGNVTSESAPDLAATLGPLLTALPNDPSLAATIVPLLTAIPGLGLPDLPGGLELPELPGGLELPDLTLPGG